MRDSFVSGISAGYYYRIAKLVVVGAESGFSVDADDALSGNAGGSTPDLYPMHSIGTWLSTARRPMFTTAGNVPTDGCLTNVSDLRSGKDTVGNRMKPQRLHPEEKLTVRWSRNLRRAIGARTPAPAVAIQSSAGAWASSTTSGPLDAALELKITNDVTREGRRAVPDTSISGRRLVRELTNLIIERGKPSKTVRDSGAIDFRCRATASSQGRPRI